MLWTPTGVSTLGRAGKDVHKACARTRDYTDDLHRQRGADRPRPDRRARGGRVLARAGGLDPGPRAAHAGSSHAAARPRRERGSPPSLRRAATSTDAYRGLAVGEQFGYVTAAFECDAATLTGYDYFHAATAVRFRGPCRCAEHLMRDSMCTAPATWYFPASSVARRGCTRPRRAGDLALGPTGRRQPPNVRQPVKHLATAEILSQNQGIERIPSSACSGIGKSTDETIQGAPATTGTATGSMAASVTIQLMTLRTYSTHHEERCA
jgi:hypothetical protein